MSQIRFPDALVERGEEGKKIESREDAPVPPPLPAEPAVPGFVIFPRYSPGQQAKLRPLAKARAFMKLAGNAFNYELLGESGFKTIASLIRDCDTCLFHYDDLEKAVQTLDSLVE